MLVLTRKVGEKIIIGDTSVVILSVEANRVKIGINAPKHIPVLREELRDSGLKK